MNRKLPRLVLVVAGTAAVAVLSVFSGGKSGGSSRVSGASMDAAGYLVACGGAGEPSCPLASAVRG